MEQNESFSMVLMNLKAPNGTSRKWSRREWGNPEINIQAQFPDENSKMTKPYFYMNKKGNRFPVNLSCESIFAEDWFIT